MVAASNDPQPAAQSSDVVTLAGGMLAWVKPNGFAILSHSPLSWSFLS
jgi:hypothetical protein